MPERTPEQIALARRTLDQIEAHPEEWNQKTWRCHTGMCFAGWAATLAGRKWAHPNNPFSELILTGPSDPEGAFRFTSDGSATHVSVAAQLALGLDNHEAAIIFSAGNDLPALRACVRAIENGEELNWSLIDDADYEANAPF